MLYILLQFKRFASCVFYNQSESCITCLGVKGAQGDLGTQGDLVKLSYGAHQHKCLQFCYCNANLFCVCVMLLNWMPAV